jgi:molybdopterin synthase catalytic subunit
VRVSVRLFAAFRERAGASSIEVDLPEGAAVAELIEAVVARVPGLAMVVGAARPVVNQEFVDPAYRLAAGDEVALLPPVSGGQDLT